MPDDQSTNYAPHIPEAVRRSAELAEQLARDATAQAQQDAGDNSEGSNQDAGSTTVVDRPAGPDGAPPQGTLPLGDNSQQAATSQPAPSQPNEWEQRYNTLRGKYDAEVPELRGELRSLRELIAAMQTAPRHEPAPTPASHVHPSREIPAEDIETYGPDLVAAAQRWAEAKFAPVLQDYERRILTIEGGQNKLTTQTAAQSVEHALDRAVPDWRDINSNPAFHMWLGQVDPFSGQRRQALIEHAHGSGDSSRTIAFFRAFLNEQTTVTPRGFGTQQVQTPDAGADRLPLADLAVPGRGSSSAATPGASDMSKRIWTTAEITAFFRDKTRGHWRNRETEAARMEAEIFAAGAEGRVRQ